MDILNLTEQIPTEFDARLWCGTAESVTVYSKEKITVRFISGTEISVGISG